MTMSVVKNGCCKNSYMYRIKGKRVSNRARLVCFLYKYAYV